MTSTNSTSYVHDTVHKYVSASVSIALISSCCSTTQYSACKRSIATGVVPCPCDTTTAADAGEATNVSPSALDRHSTAITPSLLFESPCCAGRTHHKTCGRTIKPVQQTSVEPFTPARTCLYSLQATTFNTQVMADHMPWENLQQLPQHNPHHTHITHTCTTTNPTHTSQQDTRAQDTLAGKQPG